MRQLQEKTSPLPFALFRLGFRSFFGAAGLFAVVSILLWMTMFVHPMPLSPAGMSDAPWPAHEMVFGYAMAVIARIAFFLPVESRLLQIKRLHLPSNK